MGSNSVPLPDYRNYLLLQPSSSSNSSSSSSIPLQKPHLLLLRQLDLLFLRHGQLVGEERQAHVLQHLGFRADELALDPVPWDGVDHGLQQGFEGLVAFEARAHQEGVAGAGAVFGVDHHGGVGRVDPVPKGHHALINHAFLAALDRGLHDDVLALLGRQALDPHQVVVQVHAQGDRQLARLVVGELLGLVGVPGHQIPVGDRVELQVAAGQQALLAQADHLFARQVERDLRAQWLGLARSSGRPRWSAPASAAR